MNPPHRINNVLIDKPYPALCIKNRIFRENDFGNSTQFIYFGR